VLSITPACECVSTAVSDDASVFVPAPELQAISVPAPRKVKNSFFMLE
jgi:hypothetical protein